MAFLRLKLHWQILVALALAVFAGLLTGTESALFGVTFYSIFEFLGKLFLNVLEMLIVPLIVSSIIVGIAGIGGSQNLGRLGGTTFLYYMTTSLLAILVGLLVVNAVALGTVDGQPAKDLIGFTADASSFEDKVAGKGTGDVMEIFLRMVPTNVPLLLYFVDGANPIRHFRAVSSALLTAFSTASSSATLPITIECVE